MLYGTHFLHSHGAATEMNNDINRRHVETRGKKWAGAIARWISCRNISPNQISWASLAFAAFAACFLFMAGCHQEWWMWLAAFVCVQGRLLCNLFDGMVAIEGGKHTASGEIFNDLPDRLSDPLILVATGYSISFLPFADVLGWLAGMGAVLTAYARFLGAACGAGQNFCGPMAKQHRMAVVSVAYLACAVFSFSTWYSWIIYAALCLISLGCAITVVRRIATSVRKLEARHEGS